MHNSRGDITGRTPANQWERLNLILVISGLSDYRSAGWYVHPTVKPWFTRSCIAPLEFSCCKQTLFHWEKNDWNFVSISSRIWNFEWHKRKILCIGKPVTLGCDVVSKLQRGRILHWNTRLTKKPVCIQVNETWAKNLTMCKPRDRIENWPPAWTLERRKYLVLWQVPKRVGAWHGM